MRKRSGHAHPTNQITPQNQPHKQTPPTRHTAPNDLLGGDPAAGSPCRSGSASQAESLFLFRPARGWTGYGYLVTTFGEGEGLFLRFQPGETFFTFSFLPPRRATARHHPPAGAGGQRLTATRLGWSDGRCVQGAGTYSPPDGDRRLLGIPCSRRRVAAVDPYCDPVWEICFPFRGRGPLSGSLQPACGPGVSGLQRTPAWFGLMRPRRVRISRLSWLFRGG